MELIFASVGILVVILIAAGVYELRFRSPQEIVLSEGPAGIRARTGVLYPRHFSLPLKRTSQPLQFTVDATAAGSLEVKVKVTGMVAAHPEHLGALIRAGGWSPEAVTQATQELQTYLRGTLREYTEKHEIAALSSQTLLELLNAKARECQQRFGLEIVSLTVESFEPADPEISNAMRQRERIRILEETELLNQQARVRSMRAKVKADEEIAALENEIALKKSELEKARSLKESELAQLRIEDELRRSRMRLQFEKEELELLKGNPELLMLTPQAARLAEASQSLRNARTVVSLSPQDLAQSQQGLELFTLFQGFLQKAMDAQPARGASQSS